MATRKCIYCGIKGCKKTIKSGMPIIGRKSHPALTWSCVNNRECRRRIVMKEEIKKKDILIKQEKLQAAIELLRRKCKRRAAEIERKRLEELRIKIFNQHQALARRILNLVPDYQHILKVMSYSKYTGYRSIECQKEILMITQETFEEQDDVNSERVRVVGKTFKKVYDILLILQNL